FADGTTVELPDASRAGVRAALDQSLGAGAGAQWTALVDHASRIWEVTRVPFLTSALPSPSMLLRQSLRLRDLRTVAPFTSLLAPAVGGAALARLDKTTASLSGFTMQLAVRGRTPRLRHHTVLFPADYDAEFDAVFGGSPQPVADPAVYVCAPDDQAMRPDAGHESWSVLVNAPPHDPDRPDGRGVDWTGTGLADRYARHVLDVMAGHGLDVR